MVVYGTFEGEASERAARTHSSSTVKRVAMALACTAAMAGLIALAQPPAAPSALVGSIDRNDGTDALVNAILVARGDSMPTEFVARRLNIDPMLPFKGSSAFHAPKRQQMRSHKMRLYSRIMSLATTGSGSGSGSGSATGTATAVELNPATQFCADAADCARNNDYFKANAEFHQAAHDMTIGMNGPAMPANLPGYAWCPDSDPDC
eukprot:CAMPEP_0173377676 /NCGR_PEP_ID=MMETSP1356-20130122/950_1 /TAXON_ID=77927 ORGANISM="Hemiselmis virescens, Strain PCC157" /NCGR_SAMPLE_ID=MMETSP1356 /ASSEMBLY_ACC=CAM_ASM_000847 /LENGTH=205 /DNA_ID=CAMNT_0014330519 /DNA_START=6 /DNA_END=623 /DNA_ORIENTATION=-